MAKLKLAQDKQSSNSTMATLVNLMPHSLHLYNKDPATGAAEEKPYLAIPPTGTIPRLSESKQVAQVDVIHPETGLVVPVTTCSIAFGAVENMPEPVPGTIYVVSMLVKDALKAQGRTDVMSPASGPGDAVRNPAGQIVGACALAT